MEIIFVLIDDNGQKYKSEIFYGFTDWKRAGHGAMLYLRSPAALKIGKPVRIQSIERIDIPELTSDKCRTCGEEDCVMICAACNDPVCYDCAKHSNILNEPVCKNCKTKEV